MEAHWGITLQGLRDQRKGTFGSHYRTKGQGAGKQSKSGSQVPDCPTGATVNSHMHISTHKEPPKASVTACANNNILPGAQLVKTCITAGTVVWWKWSFPRGKAHCHEVWAISTRFPLNHLPIFHHLYRILLHKPFSDGWFTFCWGNVEEGEREKSDSRERWGSLRVQHENITSIL